MAFRRHLWFTYATREHYVDSQGINKGWWVSHQSLGRESSKKSPYLIANEWICGSIAQFLRLPVPPFALTRTARKSGRMFASLKFTSGDEAPDDADGVACVNADPKLCTGITLFDALVMNPDRHKKNLAVDDPASPKVLYVYDHDHALLGAVKKKGIARLKRNEDKLVFSGRIGSVSHSHLLAKHLNTSAHFGHWLERISMIPIWFIRDVCHHDIGITKEEADAASATLITRREELERIVKKYRDRFPLISDWGLT